MSVSVYPRLEELLRAKNLSVAELERQIEQRFGILVDPKTLYRLTYAEPVQRADLQIAGAAAAVLGVPMGDLFRVEAVPVDGSDEADIGDLSPDESQRLADLFAQQGQGALSNDQRAELETLVTDYGRRLHERRLREIAELRGISVDEARREVGNDFDAALAWWKRFEASPDRRRAVTRTAQRHRTKAVE